MWIYIAIHITIYSLEETEVPSFINIMMYHKDVDIGSLLFSHYNSPMPTVCASARYTCIAITLGSLANGLVNLLANCLPLPLVLPPSFVGAEHTLKQQEIRR